jgi:hypothetical protein
VIGQQGFIADQSDRALVPALVQRLDRLRCGLSSADYRYSLDRHIDKREYFIGVSAPFLGGRSLSALI